MKIGSFVFATDQGLGILAKAFYDHGVVTDVMVIKHGRHPERISWYPAAPRIADLRRDKDRRAMADFAASMDCMLFFETPFWWPIIDHCKRAGVRTVIMAMHECTPAAVPCQPDLWLAPSKLDEQQIRGSVFVPVPVEVPWRQRTEAKVFVHNAGHGGLKGRNGTAELFEAMFLVRSKAQFIVRSQAPIDRKAMPYAGDRVKIVTETIPYEKLWDEGDVFVFPEKFNGLSLPLQEARAAGMLVMATDRFPMNDWLPSKVLFSNEPAEEGLERRLVQLLIPSVGSRRNRIGPPYLEFDEALVEPEAIASRIDEWYGQDITEYSESGREWAEEMSWDKLKPRYMELLG